MFKRYVEVLQRLEVLGTQMGVLSNRSRQELQNLLEEQAWLSATLVKQAKSQLEEIDQNLDSLFDWLTEVSNLIERAQEPGGTVEEILHLEKVVNDAGQLKDQLANIVSSPQKNFNSPRFAVLGPELKAQGEVAAALVPVAKIPAAKAPVAAAPPPKTPSRAVLTPKPSKKAAGKSSKSKKHTAVSNKAKTKNNYQPPPELLTSLAEKLAPLKKQHISFD